MSKLVSTTERYADALDALGEAIETWKTVARRAIVAIDAGNVVAAREDLVTIEVGAAWVAVAIHDTAEARRLAAEPERKP